MVPSPSRLPSRLTLLSRREVQRLCRIVPRPQATTGKLSTDNQAKGSDVDKRALYPFDKIKPPEGPLTGYPDPFEEEAARIAEQDARVAHERFLQAAEELRLAEEARLAACAPVLAPENYH